MASLVDEVTDALKERGVRTERHHRSTEDEWLFTGNILSIEGTPEVVVVESESERARAEALRSDLVGRVWVSGHENLPELLAARYRPNSPLPAKIGLVGYNLKFAYPIVEHLRRLHGCEVRIAEWPKYAVDEPAETSEVLRWADTIWCEWAGPNAAVASRAKRPGQRLVVRLHRFELERDEWKDIDFDEVDQLVVVGPHYLAKTISITGWPADRMTIVPNLVDVEQFDRPKRQGHETTLGLLGATPWRKRPDRALDLLSKLAAEDRQWRLMIKGEHPNEEKWIRDDPVQQDNYSGLFKRIEDHGDRVQWQPHRPDVADWFRSVGYILSPSEDESFHLAPAEGMASGTVPLIWPWPGAETIYDPRWVVRDTDQAARAVGNADGNTRMEARQEARRFHRSKVLKEWERLLARP